MRGIARIEGWEGGNSVKCMHVLKFHHITHNETLPQKFHPEISGKVKFQVITHSLASHFPTFSSHTHTLSYTHLIYAFVWFLGD